MLHSVQLPPYVIFILVETFSLPLLKFQVWELLAPDPKKDHGNGIFLSQFFFSPVRDNRTGLRMFTALGSRIKQLLQDREEGMDSAQGMSSLLHFLRLIIRALDIGHKANAGNVSPPRKCNPLICLTYFLILQSYLPSIQ